MIPTTSYAIKSQSYSQGNQSSQLTGLLEDAISSGNLQGLEQHLTSADALQTTLDFAVRRNNKPLAQMTLKLDAKPRLENLRDARDDDMRMLLTYACRKHDLYPHGVSHAKYTALDKSLWNHDTELARQILDEECPEPDIRKAWSGAVNSQRHDILRALLLLGEVAKARDFRLLQQPNVSLTKQIKDDNLVKVIKQIPSFSQKRPVLRNLNNVTEIACRHMSQHWMQRKAADSRFKFNYSNFENIHALQRHVHVSELDISNMKALSPEVHLIDISQFGSFLAQQFEAIHQANQTNRLMLMTSTNHDMSVALRVKKDGALRVEFYDPNVSTTHASSDFVNSRYFETQDIGSYIANPDLVKHYFPEAKGMALMFIRPMEDVLRANSGRRVTVAADRKLTSRPQDHEINGTVIWQLLREGFAGDLRDLAKIIATLPEDTQSALLSEKHDGFSGLFIAMDQNHPHAVEAYGELLDQIKAPQQRAKLLMDVSRNEVKGASPLFLALEDGNPAVVLAYAKVLRHIPDDESLVKLIAAQNDDQRYGLSMALQNGHANVIDAYGVLLEKIQDPKQRGALLLNESNTRYNDIPGLSFAFQQGHASAILGYGKLIKHVSEDKYKAKLIEAKRADGVPGLLLALGAGHKDTVMAFAELIKQIKDPAIRHELIKTASTHQTAGISGLFLALENGHADAISEFFRLLDVLPEADRLHLLEARDANGICGIHKAWEGGHVRASGMFAESLKKISNTQQRIDLLMRIYDDNAKNVLRSSLLNGNADALKAFSILLPDIATERQAGLLTDSVVSSLRHAIRMGHVEAIKTYAEIVTSVALNFDSTQRTTLLEACRDSQGSRFMGKVRNSSEYENLIKAAPDCYDSFKQMKATLDS